jgi:hypothetical protein
MSICVADAAARCADIIPLFEDVGARGREPRCDRVRGQIIRKGEIGFDAEQKAGGQSNIIAALHAADDAAERAAGRGDKRIGQYRAR